MNDAADIPVHLPPKTLADYPPLTPAEDFDALMEQSTLWLPAWCRDVWTDFNVHDPGIMVLEQITYALTELPYRANLDLPRLLVQPDGTMPWKENSLYAPTDVLPMHALTADDYARLLYDSLVHDGKPAAVYARVDPGMSPMPVAAAGCLQATVIFDPAIPAAATRSLLQQADEILAANCNLGQRFEPTRSESPVVFKLNLAFDLAPGAERAAVIAQVYSAIKRTLLPGPQFHTLEQALAAGVPIDQALEGPRLTRGVLADAELPAPVSWLEAQERATRALLGVPGIQRVVQLGFRPPATFTEPAFFALATSVAQTAISALDDDAVASGPGFVNILFAETDELAAPAVPGGDNEAPAPTGTPSSPTAAGPSAPQFIHDAQAYIAAGGETPAVQFTSLLPGQGWIMPPAPPPPDTSVSDYYSIQHQFPQLFHLEANALAPDAPESEIVAVRQLKGYLLPFEQLMANYFAQLGHVADFFSNRPQQHTVFTQPLTDVPDGLPLFAGGPGAASPASFWADPANPYLMGLGAIAEDSNHFNQQRPRVLDQLLARFNESFPTDDPTTYETIGNKEALLQDYPRLGRIRALAAPAPHGLAADKAPRPCSGLELKIRTLLRRDLQPASPQLRFLAGRRQWVHPADFYFVFEPIRFLPRAFPHRPITPKTTTRFTSDDFGPQLFHVFLNWTYQPVTPALRRYAEDLVLQNAPAHLWNRFIWVDTLASHDAGAELAARFLGLVQEWVMAGSPTLKAVVPTSGIIGLPVDAGSPAARLFTWLKENALLSPVSA